MATPRQTISAHSQRNTLAACLILGTLGTCAAAQAPAVIRVPGTVRDFQSSHPDFGVTLSTGNGHYAGNIDLTLGSDTRPVFNGAGFKVALDWKNSAAQAIAPNMYRGSNPGAVLLADASAGPIYGVFDSWDSTVGPYGGTNVGPAPILLDGSPMPVINPPASLPPSSGNTNYSNDVTITQDMHYDSLTIRKTLTVDGNVTIYCDSNLYLHTHAAIELAPGATLDVYFHDLSSTWNHVSVNANTMNPSLVRMFNLGTDDLVLHNHSEVYAQVYSPNAQMELTNHGTLFGTFHGKTITFLDYGNFHVDTPVRADLCGVVYNDTVGAAGVLSTGGIASAATFDQWYRDVLGTNLSKIHMLELTRNSSGIYEADLDQFHPIDGLLFGNEGHAHNEFFTYTFNADFIYESCEGQFIEFSGSDDAWVFVNGELVIDLGGIEPGTPQIAELDRLGLTDGGAYELRFFYAQRQTISSAFNLRTNVVLQPPTYTVAGTAGFD